MPKNNLLKDIHYKLDFLKFKSFFNHFIIYSSLNYHVLFINIQYLKYFLDINLYYQ
jgi:hypothetical protein